MLPEQNHFTLENSDYPHRAIIPRTVVAKMIHDYVIKIGYDNFKNSIDDIDYSDACNDIWKLMFRYGLPFREDD